MNAAPGIHRILLVDDHRILCDGLRALLREEPDLEVVGSACDGREAVRAVELLMPDIVVMDVAMPNMNGPEATSHIKRRWPQVRVLMLTFHTDDHHIHAALRSGADGCVLKDDCRFELLSALRAVGAGKNFLSPTVCDRVVNGYLGVAERSGQDVRLDHGADSLTTREREVIKLIAEGHRTRSIAALLSLSPKTIEKHRSNLMRKLNLRNAASVTAYAINNGFMSS